MAAKYGLIFDVDGVISDTEAVNAAASIRVFAEVLGIEGVRREDFDAGWHGHSAGLSIAIRPTSFGRVSVSRSDKRGEGRSHVTRFHLLCCAHRHVSEFTNRPAARHGGQVSVPPESSPQS